MNYPDDHDTEPQADPRLKAELLRCIAKSLMATADELDRTAQPEATQSTPQDDRYAF